MTKDQEDLCARVALNQLLKSKSIPSKAWPKLLVGLRRVFPEKYRGKSDAELLRSIRRGVRQENEGGTTKKSTSPEWLTCPVCGHTQREPRPGERRAMAYVYEVINPITFCIDKQIAGHGEVLNPMWVLSPLVDGFLHTYPGIAKVVAEYSKNFKVEHTRERLRNLLANVRDTLCGKYDLPEARTGTGIGSRYSVPKY